MKNLLQLILRSSNFLLFLALEVVAVVLLVAANDYPHSVFLSSTNIAVGSMRRGANNLASYFRLGKQNEALLTQNANLLEQLLNAGLPNDSLHDSINVEPSKSLADAYSVIPAQVIDRTTHRQHNYITLNKGHHDGIEPNMGVVGKDGVVGIVRNVSEHYAIVVPLIHDGWRLSVILPQHDYQATIHWAGGNPTRTQLEDVARHVELFPGDTVLTSGLSAIFPRNLPVGVVETVDLNEGDSYYTACVRLATDFRNLYTVNVLMYKHRNELDSINTTRQ